MENDNLSNLDASDDTEKKVKFKYFSTFSRLAVIFFVAFSIFLFISTIMLIFLTKSSKDVKVPDVVGKKFTDVYNSLVRKDIRPTINFRDVTDIDDGIVLKQHPESGEVISSNSTIKLVVSRNGFSIDTPNLVGSELPIAVNKLRNLHHHGRSVSISTGVISYIPSEKSAGNIVIAQSPRAGEIITPDRKINLLVSTGKLSANKTMPNLMGQSIDLSYDLIAAYGAVIKEEIAETWDIKKSGTIISHNPRKGSRVKEGDIVKVKVRWYPLKDHPYMAYEKIDFRIPEDEKSGLYEALIDDNMSKRIRFSRNMKPGQRIIFIFHRIGNAKVSILRDKNEVKVTMINVEEY